MQRVMGTHRVSSLPHYQAVWGCCLLQGRDKEGASNDGKATESAEPVPAAPPPAVPRPVPKLCSAEQLRQAAAKSAAAFVKVTNPVNPKS